MSIPPVIGFIGVGLMGHGVAKHLILRGGHKLAVLGHNNRAPVEDLVARGAREATTPADAALGAKVVFLCLPSSAEVEVVVEGANGLLAAMPSGSVLIDLTSADPTVTRRLGGRLAERGVRMLDAALGRTPKEAEEGRLSTYVGGPVELVAEMRPLLSCFADTIVHCGGLGAGTTCKLVSNSATIGMATLIADAFATAARAEVDLGALANVMGASGADGRMWRMIEPWVRAGDDSHLKGPLRIAAKDLRSYGRIAEAAGAAIPVAQAVSQVLRLALNQGHGEVYLSALAGILAGLNGTVIGHPEGNGDYTEAKRM
jgi:3-hydroxyisobutyrate dehydrogenase-like beta-hydroxyacid dehydrogenase